MIWYICLPLALHGVLCVCGLTSLAYYPDNIRIKKLMTYKVCNPKINQDASRVQPQRCTWYAPRRKLYSCHCWIKGSPFCQVQAALRMFFIILVVAHNDWLITGSYWFAYLFFKSGKLYDDAIYPFWWQSTKCGNHCVAIEMSVNLDVCK